MGDDWDQLTLMQEDVNLVAAVLVASRNCRDNNHKLEMGNSRWQNQRVKALLSVL